MFLKKPLAKGYNVTLTKLKIGVTAPDFTMPPHTKKSRRMAEGIQSQNALLVCGIGFA